jgi:hypothetical protein
MVPRLLCGKDPTDMSQRCTRSQCNSMVGKRTVANHGLSRCGMSVCMCCSTRVEHDGWFYKIIICSVRLVASFGVARCTRVHGTLQRTGRLARVRFSFWKLALRQGWPVGVGRWDITKHWIWTHGLVSAARVDDAGYRMSRRRRQILPPRSNAIYHGGKVVALGKTRSAGWKRSQAAIAAAGAGGMRNAVLPRTTHVDRRRRVSGASCGGGTGAVECCPAALVRIRHRRQHAGTHAHRGSRWLRDSAMEAGSDWTGTRPSCNLRADRRCLLLLLLRASVGGRD